jgi:peptidoglycan/xylan/chitin deacetylase (PgdA/CDA1 family)
VAVTFDDGYRDNLEVAKPLLERHGVPATVFVASGYVEDRREFWWDELARLLRAPDLAGRADAIVCGGVSIAAAEAYARLGPILRAAPLAQRETWLAALRAWAGEPPEGAQRADHLAVDREGLRALDGGAVEVGAHTVHHLSLAAQPSDVQEREIADGVRSLSDWLGRPVRTFAYPYGTPGTDVDRTTRRAARRAGVRLAAVNHPALAHAATSRMALPRHLVRDWSGHELERWLQETVFAS